VVNPPQAAPVTLDFSKAQPLPPSVTPIFDSNGVLRNIPQDSVAQALAAGGKPAVEMIDPQGVHRYVPQDTVSLAKENGGKLANPGFWDSMADKTAEIVKGQVKSWLSGGGSTSQDSSFQPGFNPFHPIESAGYLVPQPVKDIVNLIKQKKYGAAVGEAIPQISSQAPAILQAGLKPETVAPEAAPTATDIPPSTRPFAAGEDVEWGARNAPQGAAPVVNQSTGAPAAATPGIMGGLKRTVGRVAQAASNVIDPDITGIISPRLANAQRALGRAGGVLNPEPTETAAAAPPVNVLSPEASTTLRAPAPAPITGEATAQVPAISGVQPPRPAATPAEAAAGVRSASTGLVNPADLTKWKGNAAKAVGAQTWDGVPEHTKNQLLTQAFGEGGEFEGKIAPPEVSQAAKAQVAKAVDDAIPPTGGTKVTNMRTKAEVDFYLQRGNVDAAVESFRKNAARSRVSAEEPVGEEMHAPWGRTF
jgi:hypothetical protein